MHQGEAVADPAKWKARQITGTMLGAAIIAAVHFAKAFGYDLPIDNATANTIGGGVIAAFNVVLTVTTSRHAGLPPVGGTDDKGADTPAARSNDQ